MLFKWKRISSVRSYQRAVINKLYHPSSIVDNSIIGSPDRYSSATLPSSPSFPHSPSASPRILARYQARSRSSLRYGIVASIVRHRLYRWKNWVDGRREEGRDRGIEKIADVQFHRHRLRVTLEKLRFRAEKRISDRMLVQGKVGDWANGREGGREGGGEGGKRRHGTKQSSMLSRTCSDALIIWSYHTLLRGLQVITIHSLYLYMTYRHYLHRGKKNVSSSILHGHNMCYIIHKSISYVHHLNDVALHCIHRRSYNLTTLPVSLLHYVYDFHLLSCLIII